MSLLNTFYSATLLLTILDYFSIIYKLLLLLRLSIENKFMSKRDFSDGGTPNHLHFGAEDPQLLTFDMDDYSHPRFVEIKQEPVIGDDLPEVTFISKYSGDNGDMEMIGAYERENRFCNKSDLIISYDRNAMTARFAPSQIDHIIKSYIASNTGEHGYTYPLIEYFKASEVYFKVIYVKPNYDHLFDLIKVALHVMNLKILGIDLEVIAFIMFEDILNSWMLDSVVPVLNAPNWYKRLRQCLQPHIIGNVLYRVEICGCRYEDLLIDQLRFNCYGNDVRSWTGLTAKEFALIRDDAYRHQILTFCFGQYLKDAYYDCELSFDEHLEDHFYDSSAFSYDVPHAPFNMSMSGRHVDGVSTVGCLGMIRIPWLAQLTLLQRDRDMVPCDLVSKTVPGSVILGDRIWHCADVTHERQIRLFFVDVDDIYRRGRTMCEIIFRRMGYTAPITLNEFYSLILLCVNQKCDFSRIAAGVSVGNKSVLSPVTREHSMIELPKWLREIIDAALYWDCHEDDNIWYYSVPVASERFDPGYSEAFSTTYPDSRLNGARPLFYDYVVSEVTCSTHLDNWNRWYKIFNYNCHVDDLLGNLFMLERPVEFRSPGHSVVYLVDPPKIENRGYQIIPYFHNCDRSREWWNAALPSWKYHKRDSNVDRDGGIVLLVMISAKLLTGPRHDPSTFSTFSSDVFIWK